MTDEDHCLMLNALCPQDLCVLPRNHPGTSKNEHLLGSMYGSADPDLGGAPNPKYREKFKKRYCPMAPEGTPAEDMWRLSCELSARLFPE